MQVYGHERENYFQEKVHGKELKPLSCANSALECQDPQFPVFGACFGTHNQPSVFHQIFNIHKPHFPLLWDAGIRSVPVRQAFVPEALFFMFGLAP
jgi:hypothetical protein